MQENVQCSCLSLCICQDFHGHSKKEGIFFYGGKAEDRDRNGDIQLLPRSLVRADIHHQKLSLQTGEGKTGLLGTEIFCIMEGRVGMKEDQKQKHSPNEFWRRGFPAPFLNCYRLCCLGSSDFKWGKCHGWHWLADVVFTNLGNGFQSSSLILHVFFGLRCAFNVNESKMSTARLVGFLQLRIQRAYTVPRS